MRLSLSITRYKSKFYTYVIWCEEPARSSWGGSAMTGTKQMQVQLLLMAKKRKKEQMSDSAITELYQARSGRTSRISTRLSARYRGSRTSSQRTESSLLSRRDGRGRTEKWLKWPGCGWREEFWYKAEHAVLCTLIYICNIGYVILYIFGERHWPV